MLSHELFITISQEGEIKMGTCQHCVVLEKGRPERAWDPDGDKELDFNRDGYIQAMRELGVTVTIEQQYVCP